MFLAVPELSRKMSSQSSSNMTIEEIEQALRAVGEKENGNKALEIINFISYFSPKKIPIKMFLSLVGSEKELEAAIKLLKEYSIVDSDKEETVLNIDKLVQQVIRSNLETREKKEEILKKALEIIIECGIDSSNLDHAISIWSYASEYQELIKELSGLTSHVVRELGRQVRHKEANMFGFKALSILRRTIGENHPATLTLQHNIGTLLEKEGKYKEALEILLPLYLKDVEISGKREITDTLVTIARQMCELSQYDEALPIYRRILGSQQVSQTNDGTILTAWHDYALLLSDLGNYQDSLKILREVLKKRTEMLGEEDIHTIQTKSSIAQGLVKQCKYPEALQFFQEVFNKKKQVLGENHPDTLRERRDIGLVLQKQGRYDEAVAIYKNTAENFKQVLGEDHPDTLATQANLASIFHIKKELHKALEIYRDVYKRQSEILGQQHIETLTVQLNMATLLIEQKKCDEGLKFLQEVYKGFTNILGPNHPNALRANTDINSQLILCNLLFTAVKQNNLKKTEDMIRHGVAINFRDTNGWAPLHYAVNNPHKDIVNILLTNGADITQVTNKGNTPLHIAVLKGYKEIVEILLQQARSAKLTNFINTKSTGNGTTALHVAAKNGSLEIAKSLLKHGAIYNIENKESKTPFDMSKDQKVTDLLKLIEELFEGARGGNAELISKLKALKPNEFATVTDARNDQGYTLLQVTIANEHKDIASELMKMLKKA